MSCPPSTTAASGMDAFTQLLESYLSTAANPITDALACEGLACIAGCLKPAYDDSMNREARTGMALAAYLSGITLANAGLGLVHGFASPLGGYFDIPHGIICSALMAPVNEVTVRKLRRTRTNPEALIKYSTVGKLFAGSDYRSQDYYIDFLLHVIQNLAEELHIPALSKFGVMPSHYEKIIRATDNKNHPIPLGHDEMAEVLERGVGSVKV
jgi:alcohol dehydrogenase class IV